MNEKIPIPCQRCHASGLTAGIECSECGGKGYRMIIGGQLAAPTRPIAPKRWRNKPQDRRR